jgi:SAM-dependent MidA family methyltransferase
MFIKPGDRVMGSDMEHGHGPDAIPAAEVMARALYDPMEGYYRRVREPWGFEGADYFTALDLGPLLGQALAARLEQVWVRLDRPDPFLVVEPGAGRGWLGRDLLAAAEGDFREALHYRHQDDNPAGLRAAREALAPFGDRAGFLGEDEPLPPFTGALVSNELFDALPAQPWRWEDGAWRMEVLGPGGPEWREADPLEAGAWFAGHAEGGLEPRDGGAWCEGMPALVGKLAGALGRGLFLAIDYGDEAARLVAKGADLRRYKGHTVDGRWWEDLGRCDLTADVDFTRLAALLEAQGLRDVGHQTLSRWIRAHAPLARWEAGWQELPAPDRLKRMENLLQLTLPGMMGERFRVLEAWREGPCP